MQPWPNAASVCKRLGNTAKRWLKAPGDVSPKYLRRSDPTKLSAYEVTLIMALKTDAHRRLKRTNIFITRSGEVVA